MGRSAIIEHRLKYFDARGVAIDKRAIKIENDDVFHANILSLRHSALRCEPSNANRLVVVSNPHESTNSWSTLVGPAAAAARTSAAIMRQCAVPQRTVYTNLRESFRHGAYGASSEPSARRRVAAIQSRLAEFHMGIR